MSPEATHIFNPRATLDPSLMVHLLETWARDDPHPMSILSDIRVTILMHNKMLNAPEHEFLVVETEDSVGTRRLFVLERTTDPGLGTVPAESRASAFASVKELCATMTSSTSELASVEEGLQNIDRLTLGTVKAASIISDSLDKKGSYTAVDRFVGSDYVFSVPRQARNLRFLRPNKRFSLYQLALIARAVQQRFSTYDVLKEQCYFHAGVIYSAVQHQFGSLSTENPEECLEVALPSGFRCGRYLGFKVQSVDRRDVLRIIDDFNEAYAKAIDKVSLSISGFHLIAS
jgi:hypothetical protein